ncbi:MAG: S26 family signal peptidase [Altererythrobacter sp.]|nr:S26 family signal peptidase [Altererythrobacter sp.]
MRRLFYARATGAAVGLFAGLFTLVAVLDPVPRLIWNASASAPIGLYRVRPVDRVRRGDLVAVAPPERLAAFLAARGYLPEGVPLLKHVVALPGQLVCRTAARVTVDGRLIAIAREADRLGRPLPSWQGCRRLAGDELFLANPDVPDSMDGRYFGPLPAGTVIGRATPLWVDPPAQPASPPQPQES